MFARNVAAPAHASRAAQLRSAVQDGALPRRHPDAVRPPKLPDDDGCGSPACLAAVLCAMLLLPVVAILLVPFIDPTALRHGHKGVVKALHSITPRGRAAAGGALREHDGAATPAGAMVAEGADRAVRLYAFGDDYTSGSGRVHNCSSYRYHLWRSLQVWRTEHQRASTDRTNAPPHVVFIGSEMETGEGPPLVAAFDSHHEGHPGWSTRDAEQWLLRNVDSAPRAAIEHDVALITLGAHDLVQNPEEPPRDIAARVRAVAENLRRREPGGPGAAAVLVATVPPLQAAGDDIDRVPVLAARKVKALNEALIAMCAQVAAERSPGQRAWLSCVDINDGLDPNMATIDGLRPSDALERTMAQRWFVAIKPLLEDVRVGVEAYVVMMDRKRAAAAAAGDVQRAAMSGKGKKCKGKKCKKRGGQLDAAALDAAAAKEYLKTFEDAQASAATNAVEAGDDDKVSEFLHPIWRAPAGQVSADDPGQKPQKPGEKPFEKQLTDPFAFARYDDVEAIRMRAEMGEMRPPPPSPPPHHPWVVQLLEGRQADVIDEASGLRQVSRQGVKPTAVVVRPERDDSGKMSLASSDAHVLSSLPHNRAPPEPETSEERMAREMRDDAMKRRRQRHAELQANASAAGAEAASAIAAEIALKEAAHRVHEWR